MAHCAPRWWRLPEPVEIAADSIWRRRHNRRLRLAGCRIQLVARSKVEPALPRPQWQWVLVVAVLAVFALPVQLAPLFPLLAAISDVDVTSNTNAVQNGASFTIVGIDMTGADFCILAFGMHNGTGSILGGSTAYTLGGNAMSHEGSSSPTVGDSAQSAIFTWTGTSLTGSQDLVCTGYDASVRSGGVAASYSGVDQTTPVQGFVAASSNSSNAPAISITTTSGNLAWGAFCARHSGTGQTVTEGGTQRPIGTAVSDAGTAGVTVHGSDIAGGGTAFSWSLNQTVGNGACAIEVVAASGGGATSYVFRPRARSLLTRI